MDRREFLKLSLVSAIATRFPGIKKITKSPAPKTKPPYVENDLSFCSPSASLWEYEVCGNCVHRMPNSMPSPERPRCFTNTGEKMQPYAIPPMTDTCAHWDDEDTAWEAWADDEACEYFEEIQ